MPLGPVAASQFDRLLEEGDRRSGRLLYRTRCPSCNACQPLRVPTGRFVATRNQRRVLRHNEDIEVAIGAPQVDEARVNLYNRHRHERDLARSESQLTADQYRSWLVSSCVPTVEVAYRVGGELVAVSVLDVGQYAVSSVYHYFNPDHARRSLGVFSALWEIAWSRLNGRQWYYLGFYVEDCGHLSYKAGYFPHQRKIDGRWWEQAEAGAPLVEIGL